MKTQFALLRTKGAKLVTAITASAGAFVTTSAYALDDTAITAAQDAAKTSVELTAAGMIQIVAVIVGVSLVVALLKRV